MTDQSVSAARKREFWDNLAAKPITWTEYDLSDEHMRGLQSDKAIPEATALKLGHFDAWLAEHDRRVKEEAWEEGVREGYQYGRQEENLSLAYALPTNNPYSKSRP